MVATADDPEDIDTPCMAHTADDQTADGVNCGDPSVTFVRSARGYRVYLCEHHAERLGDAVAADDIFTGTRPTVRQCGACGRYVAAKQLAGVTKCQFCRGG